MLRRTHLKVLSLIFTLLLQGCALERLSQVGDAPKLSQIHNPTQLPGYNPVSMPMPHPHEEPNRINSLWQTGSKAFFKDQRASKVGDIITIVVEIDQQESIEVNPNIQKSTSNDVTVNNALGYEYKAQKLMPKKQPSSATAVGAASLAGTIAGAVQPQWMKYSSKPSLSGTGKYDIKDKMNFKLAATVIQILANGNMVVQGRTEIKLANEVREIEVKGIIRREDVGASNTIKSDKIAEMRINYAGRGDLSDLNEIPWGQQIASKVLPF